MKLTKGILFFLIMILLAGCTKEDLNWYGIVVFKPVEAAEIKQMWTAELQYVDYSETEETPPDVLRITYNEDSSSMPEEVSYQIPNTNIEGMVRLSNEGLGEAIIDRSKLLTYIKTIVLEDGTITGSIPLVIRWGNQTEHLELPYLTAIKDFEQTNWERLIEFFT
ncbi:hypothetical protein ACLM5H_00470 [Fredinandcohnia humi]